MSRCALIVALGLCAMSGVGEAMAQEGAARGGGAPTAPATPPRYADWKDRGTGGAVSAGGREAVAAGIEILKRGGNAADAAAATILALSVTDARSFCFGGEVPILVYDAETKGSHGDRRPGRRTPAGDPGGVRASRRHSRSGESGGGGPGRARRLPHPARPVRHDDFYPGRRADATDPRPAVASRSLARRLRPDARNAGRRRGHGLSRSGSPTVRPLAGAPLVADAFYRGPIARRIDAWSRANGGLIRYVDLATHTTRIEEPVSITYRGLTVYKCGAVDPGTLPAPGPANPRGIRPQGDGARPTRDDPHDRRGDEAGHGRPRHLLRRSPVRRRAAGGAPDAGLCRQAPGADRPEACLAGAPAGRSPLGQGGPRSVGRSGQRGPTPPVAAVHDTTTCLVADRAATSSRPRPAAGRASWPVIPASGWAAGCKASTPGRVIPTSSSPASGRGSPCRRPSCSRGPEPVLAVSVAGGDNQDQMILQLLLDQIDFGLAPAERWSHRGS